MSAFTLGLAAALVFLVLHITTMALTARAMGIRIRRITYGVGPKLFQRGTVQLKAIPLSGSVLLKDSREEVLSGADTADALNHQAVWKQVLLPLSGPLVALLLAALLIGPIAAESFLAAFEQILGGAVSPLGVGQVHLASLEEFFASSSFAVAVGFTLTKLAAFNLLPLGGFNGSQALINLVRWKRTELPWEAALNRWLVVPALLIFISLSVAVLVYVLH